MSNWTPNPGQIPPGLHFVATPIGAARDITLKALDLLAGADVLAAEDTRTLRHLMEIHGVALNGRQVLAYHDHNGDQMRPRLIDLLKQGKSVAYASEAGTPLLADPGYQLACAAIDEGLTVLAAPGPSALLCALSVSGLPTDRFFFAGFLPPKSAARRTGLRDLAAVPGTMVFYESPKRIAACLSDMAQVLGPTRRAAVCRELTKRFEEILRGTLAELAEITATQSLKGEIVVVVERAEPVSADPKLVKQALINALETLSCKDAATEVAEQFGLPRRDVYQMALLLEGRE